MNLALPIFNSSSRWYYTVRWLVLIVLGLAIYSQTFGFDFVFDDNDFIIINSHIKNFDNIHTIWKVLPKTRLIGIYSFALNYFFNQLHPFGYHVFNFIVHLITVGLVWATSHLLFQITGWLPSKDKLKQELPFIIALLFLVHPVQTQAITYISQRFESMAALFYLSSVYCYLRARVSLTHFPKFLLFISSIAFAILGIFTKETAATIPFAILAAELILWPKDFQKIKSSKTALIWIAGTLLFILLFMKIVGANLDIFFHFHPTSSESHDGDMITASHYVFTQFRVFLTFTRLLIFPINQNVDYDYALSANLWTPSLTLFGLALIGFVIFLIAKLRKAYPLISFGLVWMLITFSINLAPRKNVIFEHKLYLISFGFLLAAVVALSVLVKQRNVFIILMMTFVVALSLTSFERNKVWKNPLTLWEDSIKKSPHKQRVYANLGNAYNKYQYYDQAIAVLNTAIAMKHSDYTSYMCRGIAYDGLNLEDQALKDINQSISINPKNYAPYIMRFRVYRKQKNYDAALADISQAIHLQPDFEYNYVERGMLLMDQGKVNDALNDLQHAITISPYDFRAIVNRGGIYAAMGRYEDALKDLNRAQLIDSNNIMVYKNKAYCLLKLGRLPEAIKNFEMILRMDPNDSVTREMYNRALNIKS